MKFSAFFYVIFMLSSLSAFASKTQLALNWKPEPEFGGFYAALVHKIYEKNNLNVEILEGGSGTPTVQMLANGKIDFAIVSADELIISQERNPTNKIIALFAVYQKSPYIVMTHAEKSFSSLKEVWFSSGVLAMQSGLPYYQYLVSKWGPPKIRIVPYSGGVGNFINDKNFSQQGFLSTEPVTAERLGTKTKNFIVAEEGFNPYLVVLATTEETLKTKPLVIKQMLRSVRTGWEEYLKNSLPTNQHMAQLNKALDLETFQKGAELQKALITDGDPKKVGHMTKERWDQLAQQLVDLKLIKKIPPASSYFRDEL